MHTTNTIFCMGHTLLEIINFVLIVYFVVTMHHHKEDMEVYKKAIRGKFMLRIRPVRMNYVGLPRSGKTTFRLRLRGEILNIIMAMARGEYKQPSTGVAEAGGQILICSLCSDLGTIQSQAEKV